MMNDGINSDIVVQLVEIQPLLFGGAHFDAKSRELMAPMIIDCLVCCNAASKVVLGYSATNGLFDLSLHRIGI